MPGRDEGQREAEHLHAALFPGRPIPPDLAARYCEARSRFFENDRVAGLMEILLAKRIDAGAVEFALRVLHGPNGLTRRFQVISSLAEARGAYYGHFFQTRDRRLPAWAAMPRLAAKTVWKLAKGLALVRLYGLRRFAGV